MSLTPPGRIAQATGIDHRPCLQLKPGAGHLPVTYCICCTFGRHNGNPPCVTAITGFMIACHIDNAAVHTAWRKCCRF